MDEQMQDPSMGQEMPQESGGLTIEIRVDSDGTIKVGVEPASQEMEETDESGEQYQTVPDIKSALKLAMEIYSGQGQASQSEQGEMDAAYAERQ